MQHIISIGKMQFQKQNKKRFSSSLSWYGCISCQYKSFMFSIFCFISFRAKCWNFSVSTNWKYWISNSVYQLCWPFWYKFTGFVAGFFVITHYNENKEVMRDIAMENCFRSDVVVIALFGHHLHWSFLCISFCIHCYSSYRNHKSITLCIVQQRKIIIITK